jgi:MFS family permease
VLGVYLPSLLFEIGVGAIVPIVPLAGVRLGSSLAVAGGLAALLGVGQILADVPAGWLAGRFGDRVAMLLASALAVLALVGCALATDVATLAAGVLVIGMANSVFLLARQAYLTAITPVLRRARALSALGGVGRIGLLVGPFGGALTVHLWGTAGAFWLAVATTGVTAAVVAVVPDVHEPVTASNLPRASMLAVARAHRAVLTQVGSAVLLVGAVRAARQVVLPLWAVHLGLAPATTSLVFGLSGVLDVAVFWPAGKAMDKYGRLWVAVPSTVVLGVSIAVLPVVGTVSGLVVVAVVMGLGNGIGSGIVMTLAADLAPPAARPQFLGTWRLLQDTGTAVGPLVVSGLAAAGSLALGVLVGGLLGLLAAGVLAVTVPRWSVHANGTTRARAGLRPDGRPR